VTRHQGTLRYNASYFRGLIQLAKEDWRLRCLLAVYDEHIIGFLVIALAGSTAYYLHGATDMTCQHYRPADLLFHEAITWAKDTGIQSFNMMASPRRQKSLIRYKEKWGCTSKPQYTYDLIISSIHARMFNLILNAHASINSLISTSKKLTLTFAHIRRQYMK
jgi:lipid II:glycine glycyltransferase (peptidoglycan interpeptide bridge formation enzyme)